MKTHKIVSAQLTKEFLTLATDEGKLINIPQGRSDLPVLIALCQNHLVPGGEPLYLTQEEIDGVDAPLNNAPIAAKLMEIEERSGGVVRFFRMARRAASKLFGMSNQSDGTFVRLDTNGPYKATSAPEEDEEGEHLTEEQRTALRIEEVMSQAKPITEKEVKEGINVARETVVAVTNKGAMIGTEALETFLTQSEDTMPVQKLIERIASVELEHTAQDVLSFVKRGDLPLTKDGNIIAYKKLVSWTQDGLQGYVDVHSRTVFQCVGDVVEMPAHMVDKNRRHSCSVGLHVARRNYLRNFSGNRTVIILIHPEDVIAVPHGEPDKVRVSRYQIIAELSADGTEQLNNNMALDPKLHKEDLAVIQRLVQGWVPPVTAIVTVAGPKAYQVSRKVLTTIESTDQTTEVVELTVTPLDNRKVTPTEVAKPSSDGPKVDPNEIVLSPRKIEAKRLYDAWKASKSRSDLDALVAFKKKAKVSWETLGMPEMTAVVTNLVIQNAPSLSTNAAPTEAKPLSYSEQINALRPIRSKAKALKVMEIKKQAKKGWATLKVTETEIKFIEACTK